MFAKKKLEAEKRMENQKVVTGCVKSTYVACKEIQKQLSDIKEIVEKEQKDISELKRMIEKIRPK
jgi:hypothetical protein